jgi:AAA15 family ATPase/GTPase
MELLTISFFKKKKNKKGWKIENCNIGNINLISGKNSSGKTRFLTSIYTLSDILSGKTEISKVAKNTHLRWEIKFRSKGVITKLILEYKYNKIFTEELSLDGKIYLKRDENGEGLIQYEELKQKVSFEVENSTLVITSKRDKKQHPLLEDIFSWSENIYLYKFGTKLGRTTLIGGFNLDSDIEEKNLSKLSKDDEAVVVKFDLGMKIHGEKFHSKILEDLNSVGYSLDEIASASASVEIPEEIRSQINIPSILYVVEKGIDEKIPQFDISQGMFRVISLVIQLNYLEFNMENNSKTTILIDDIGEGLDFERSTKLIKLLISKAEYLKDNIQLIMTTNDRFVMNIVPLDYWIVIDREIEKIVFYSKISNKSEFEEFELIGLNNFDFFTGEFYKPKNSNINK